MRALVLVGVLAACAVATPPPSPPRHTNLGLRVSSGSLPNGLRVVLVHDPHAADVQVTMRYRVGAIDDPSGQEGVAHLVEHLMFQQVLGAQTLFAKLEDATSSFNATTSFEATTFFARANPARLEELLSIEAVRVGFRCTSITDSVFAREREVVLNELRQRDFTTDLFRALHEGLYPDGHPYRRTVSGSAESVGAITREQACAFADAHYTPANAVLVVSGAITTERLDAALAKFLVRIPARTAQARGAAPPVPAAARRTVRAPVDEEALIVAWPLPADPGERVKVQTVVKATAAEIRSAVAGFAQPVTLGDESAPLVGIVVLPEVAVPQLVKAIGEAIDRVDTAFRETDPEWLGKVAFDMLQQGAIHGLFEGLEEGSDRDIRFAASVLAGRDPNALLAAESAALRALTPAEAQRIARTHLRSDRMTVATLQPRENTRRGVRTQLATPVHDLGLRRDPPDPAEARQPYDAVAPRTLAGVQQRTLANGMRVVLLPVTSVPTVEVRLVFASGTADEPAARRGAALAAAKVLEWDPRHFNDFLLFVAGGGSRDVEVGTDATAFTARGLDMHLDVLLAGLRRWVRDGRYDDDAIPRLRATLVEDEAALEDAWRVALFGAQHPYVAAGVPRHVSPALALEDVERFRATHHTPANATLVIAGKFDAALAERWIDHLFADWRGAAPAVATVRAAPRPASIAKDEDIAQAHVRIALPASHGQRAAQLVAAAMLSQIASDVRHQLGASYGFDVRLDESRLATTYVFDGRIDAARTGEALELVRARVEALRADPDTAARAFVHARKRVVTQLLGMTASARELAARVQQDIELGRAPMADLRTADEVRALTIERMTDVLADLDLARGVMFVRGPTEHVDRAYAVLGRTATRVAAATDAEEPGARAAVRRPRTDDAFTLDDIEEPLTLQGPAERLAVGVFAGYATGRVVAHDVSGYTVGAHVGYRFRRATTAGVHIAFGGFDGSYEIPQVSRDPFEVTARPFRIGGFIHAIAYDRLWGGAIAGLSFVRVTDGDAPTAWHAGAGIGVEGGIDLVRFHDYRLAVYGRIDSELASDASFAGFTIGLGVRR